MKTNRAGEGAIVGTAGNGLLIAACSTGAAQTDDRRLFKVQKANAAIEGTKKRRTQTVQQTKIKTESAREVDRGRRRVQEGSGLNKLSYRQS